MGLGDEFLIARAIDYAVANGADVINLSLGTTSESKLLEEAVKRATQASVVVVSAAGNLNTSAEQYPAAESCSLAITSVGSGDVKSDFSELWRLGAFQHARRGHLQPIPAQRLRHLERHFDGDAVFGWASGADSWQATWLESARSGEPDCRDCPQH